MRLLALSDREFKREADPEPVPASKRLRPIRLSLARYDAGWVRKRGAAARMMAVVLRESDEALTARVCQSDQSAGTYGGAAEWMAGEAKLLRKHVRHLEAAAGRLAVAIKRCAAPSN
jgi:hypothetical protein